MGLCFNSRIKLRSSLLPSQLTSLIDSLQLVLDQGLDYVIAGRLAGDSRYEARLSADPNGNFIDFLGHRGLADGL